jgi:hypothetical protein
MLIIYNQSNAITCLKCKVTVTLSLYCIFKNCIYVPKEHGL